MTNNILNSILYTIKQSSSINEEEVEDIPVNQDIKKELDGFDLRINYKNPIYKFFSYLGMMPRHFVDDIIEQSLKKYVDYNLTNSYTREFYPIIQYVSQHLAKHQNTNVLAPFYVIKDKSLNAFAIPTHGTIVLTTGLLNVYADDVDALKSIVAHEASHIVLRHGSKIGQIPYLILSGKILKLFFDQMLQLGAHDSKTEVVKKSSAAGILHFLLNVAKSIIQNGIGAIGIVVASIAASVVAMLAVAATTSAISRINEFDADANSINLLYKIYGKDFDFNASFRSFEYLSYSMYRKKIGVVTKAALAVFSTHPKIKKRLLNMWKHLEALGYDMKRITDYQLKSQ
jgi:Zn-dependent protease with chaperone function